MPTPALGVPTRVMSPKPTVTLPPAQSQGYSRSLSPQRGVSPILAGISNVRVSIDSWLGKSTFGLPNRALLILILFLFVAVFLAGMGVGGALSSATNAGKGTPTSQATPSDVITT